ncbi:sensor domain-containing diguanylate cyclase [Clostridium grantii]|uniref:Diguanylate cyclase (GGDEF) domain-containing protein n=1 Tax=Clostridium grantii DSM 8605 TaxID=1121316 RepID=A0A1M5XBW4_9CLOT|nr:sensor domain-containing diguanylate cyclase [Clostridium grantii]SHH97058.1 diguanylate cyclase (GGDEF) domain-containing protein [Clostridium grantii DSM 8605]
MKESIILDKKASDEADIIDNAANESDLYLKSLEERVTILTTLKEVNFYMGNSLELIDVIKNIIDVVLGVLGVTSCSICLKKESKWSINEKNMLVNTNVIDDKYVNEIYEIIEKQGGELLIKDLAHEPKFNQTKGSFIAIEINRKDIKYGYIALYYDNPETISESKIELFRLIVAQFGLYIENAYLYESVTLASITDNLTGMYNRTHLNRTLTNKCFTNIEKVGIIMADIDDFKKINDNYGHLFGDVVLKYTGELFKEVAKEYNGTAFRYGGEEMLIVFENIDKEKLCSAANEINEKFRENTYFKKDKKLNFTISVGVSKDILYFKDLDIFKLINLADEALYEAKKSGKNCYKVKTI